MPALDQLIDPWAVAGRPGAAVPDAPSAPARWRPWVAWLASLGIVVQVWRDGGQDPAAVAAGLVAAALLELAVRFRRGAHGWAPVARVLAVGAVVAGSVPFLGITPAVLLALTVVVADAAIVGWAPTRAWPARSVPTVGIAVGLLVLAQVSWIRVTSRPVVLVLLLLGLAVVEAYGRWPARAERADAGLRHGIEVVAVAVAGAILAVVAAVVLYLPGFLVRVVRAPFAPGRERRLLASSWEPVRTSVGDVRRDAAHTFTSTAPEVRARRTRAGLAAVAVVALVATLVVRNARSENQIDVPPELQASGATTPTGASGSASTTTRVTDPKGRQVFATDLAAQYGDLPAYAGVPWANDLQQQETGVVNGTLETEYVNIRNGRRVTIDPTCDGCPRATLWLSGGSAAFGTGQRDGHTIASELVRIAEERDGIALEVQNHSHDGYTFQMEDEWEIEQSLRTEDPPDLIVFYNGWNDAMAELAQEYLRGPDPDRKMSMIIPTDLDAINQDTDAFLDSDIGAAAGAAAAERYLAVQERVDAAAEDAGVETAYFFQADALAAPDQLRDYEQINGITTEAMLASPLTDTLDAMTDALGDRVVNLRSLFDGFGESTFLGLVHQNETGARRVAEAIYDELRPQIRKAAKD